MKFAFCPTDPTHQRFGTTIHVMQTVVVTPNGDFLEELNPCDEVTHGPDPDNTWTCMTCGVSAQFREHEADEIEQEDLEAASELLAKLEAGQLQCGCDPSSCDHKYLGDEPGPYPRDRREKKGT